MISPAFRLGARITRVATHNNRNFRAERQCLPLQTYGGHRHYV
jgi:hypothetical protein